MTVNRLLFIAFLAIFHSLTTNDIAFPVSLTQSYDANANLIDSDSVQIGQIDEVEITPMTTVEILCDCDDNSCLPKPEPEFESTPVPALW